MSSSDGWAGRAKHAPSCAPSASQASVGTRLPPRLSPHHGSPRRGRYALFLLTSLGTLLLGCLLRAQFWQALCGCGISTLRFKKARAAAPEKEPEEIVEEILQGSTLRTRLGNAFEEAAEWNPLLTSLQVIHLPDISPRSPLWNPLLTSLQGIHLPYISRTSPPYLPCR